jgi:hypothetical protein
MTTRLTLPQEFTIGLTFPQEETTRLILPQEAIERTKRVFVKVHEIHKIWKIN